MPPKPLPDIPGPIPRLTIDATAHLERIICTVLTEEGLPTSSWLEPISSTLRHVGDSLAREDWLDGLRRAKLYRHELATKAFDVAAETTPTTAVDATIASTPTKKPRSSHSPTKHNRDAETAGRAMALLLQLTTPGSSSESAAPAPGMHHLVFTLAPRHEAPLTTLFGAGAGECTFVPGKFFLPSSGVDGIPTAGGTDITGVETWKCK